MLVLGDSDEDMLDEILELMLGEIEGEFEPAAAEGLILGEIEGEVEPASV